MPKKQFRYVPEDNRTPVNHPVFGHLEYGTVIDNPEAEGLPGFELIEAKPRKTSRPRKAKTAPAAPAAPAATSADVIKSAAEPSAKQTDAGTAGGSK